MGGGENDGILIKCIKPNGVPQHILREGSERRTKITRFCDRAHFCGKPPKTIEETTGFARCCATTAFLDARPETLQTRGVIAFSRNGSKTRNFFLSRGLRTQSRAGFNRGSATFPKEPRVRYNGPEKTLKPKWFYRGFPLGAASRRICCTSPGILPHQQFPKIKSPNRGKEFFRILWNQVVPGFLYVY